MSQSLSTLTRAVRAILADPPEPTPESLQSLYALCESLIGPAASAAQRDTAQTLYDRVRIEIERKVGDYATHLRKSNDTDGQVWLVQLQSIWKSFNEKIVGVLLGMV